VPDFEADVPERTDQPLERLALGRLRFVREQDEEVDVRARIEFAATIATGGNERCARRQVGHGLYRAVDELRVGFQQRAGPRMREIRCAQRGTLGRNLLAQRGGAHAGGGVPLESVRTS
jgi:hypothetical protein